MLQQASFSLFSAARCGLGGCSATGPVPAALKSSQSQQLLLFREWWDTLPTTSLFSRAFSSVSPQRTTESPISEQQSEKGGKTGDTLSRWLEFCVSTPPVRLLPGVERPTALSWLRRRGPPLANGTLHRLFRDRQVRVFDGRKVKKVTETRLLEAGHLLLVPKVQCAGLNPDSERLGSLKLGREAPRTTCRDEQGEGDEEEDDEDSEEAAAERELKEKLADWGVFHGTLEERDVRQWVIGRHPEFLVLDKPAGVVVQGPGDSLDNVMRTALVYNEDRDQPRLVHRLDRDVSGALLVARSANAAAWLAAAFRAKSVQVEGTEKQGTQKKRKGDSAGDAMYIKRVYLALVARDMEPKKGGRVNGAVLVDGTYQSAQTHYRVMYSNNGMSLLQLIPETGRKHQLRLHCARFLHAPIVGDIRYGYKGESAMQLAGFTKRSLVPRYSSRRSSGNNNDSDNSSSSRSNNSSSVSDSSSSNNIRKGGSSKSDIGITGSSKSDNSGNDGGSSSGSKFATFPIMLHSYSVIVSLPRKKPLQYVAPIPPYMMRVMQQLGWKPPRP